MLLKVAAGMCLSAGRRHRQSQRSARCLSTPSAQISIAATILIHLVCPVYGPCGLAAGPSGYSVGGHPGLHAARLSSAALMPGCARTLR